MAETTPHPDTEDDIRAALATLDGTLAGAVRLLTGFDDDELAALGGLDNPTT